VAGTMLVIKTRKVRTINPSAPCYWPHHSNAKSMRSSETAVLQMHLTVIRGLVVPGTIAAWFQALANDMCMPMFECSKTALGNKKSEQSGGRKT